MKTNARILMLGVNTAWLSVLALVIAALPFTTRAGTFTSDFTKGVDTNYWGLWTSFPAGYCTNINDAQGVTFQRIAGSDRQSFNAGLRMGFADVQKITKDGGFITGDFVVTMTYTNLNNFVSSSGDFFRDASNQLKLYLQWGGGGPDGVHVVQVYSCSRNYYGWFQETAYQGNVYDSQYPWQAPQKRVISPAAPGNSGTLKMVRTNGVLSYYINEQQIGVGEGPSSWTTNGLWSVNLSLVQGIDAAHVGVTLQSCTISGPNVKDQAPVAWQWTTNNLPSGLIAWWQAESNMLDSAGPHHGTGSTAPTYGPGRFGQAFQFNGTDQSVAIPNSYPDLDGWTQFTLEAWVNMDSTSDRSGGQAVFTKVGNVSDHVNYNQGYQFGFFNNASWAFLQFNTNSQAWPGFSTRVNLGAPLLTNTWYHLVGTYDHNAVKIYLNGVPLVTNVVGPATIRNSSSTLRISKDDNLNGPFAGRIDDARIYNRALTAAEIASLCAGPNPPVNKPMLKHTPKGDGNLTFEWDTISNQTYHVESASNLANPNWQRVGSPPVGGLIIATNTATSVSCPVGPEIQRFYRVVTP